MRPLITITYSDADLEKQIVSILELTLKSEGFDVEFIETDSLSNKRESKYSSFAGVFIFSKFDDADKIAKTVEGIKKYLKNSGGNEEHIIVVSEGLGVEPENILRNDLQVNKVIEPEKWEPIPIAARVLAAIYGGFGKFDKNNLVQMQGSSGKDSKEKLYLEYKIQKTYAQYTTSEKNKTTISINPPLTITKTIIGSSKKMRELFSEIKELSRSTKKTNIPKKPVLIRGKTGAGKEMVAEAIHFYNEANTFKYSPLNITEFSPKLLENELFGHEKEAYTGADENKIGLLIEAGEGTIFLDEIGELDILLQPKLLRVLENREVRPLGSTKIFQLQARFITATNKVLETMISDGEFRYDFYQRIKGKELNIPALDERKSELELLAKEIHQKWNEQQNNEYKLELRQQDFDKIVDCCITHTFHGNVRALKRILENSLDNSVTNKNSSNINFNIQYLENELEMDDKSSNRSELPGEVENKLISNLSYSITVEFTPYAENLKGFAKKTKEAMVKEVYKACDSDPRAAEKQLGISKGTFYKHVGETKNGRKKSSK